MTEEMNKKVDEILKKINPEEIKEIMSEMALALLTGQVPDMVDTYVRLSVPKPVYDIVNNLCRKLEINPEEVFSRMASEGFTNSLKSVTSLATEVIQEEEQEQVKGQEEALKTLAPGLDKIMGSFNQLNGLVQQLQTMQKVLENANLTDPTSTPGPGKNS